MKRSEEIIEAAKPYISDPKEYHGFIMGADWAIERFAPKWISVEEQLPPQRNEQISVPVLTYCPNQYIYSRGEWLWGDRYATHWMPLPERPKGGEE